MNPNAVSDSYAVQHCVDITRFNLQNPKAILLLSPFFRQRNRGFSDLLKVTQLVEKSGFEISSEYSLEALFLTILIASLLFV